jgi:hypothetical protein
MGWDSDVRSAYSWFSNAIDAFGLLVVCSAQKNYRRPGHLARAAADGWLQLKF